MYKKLVLPLARSAIVVAVVSFLNARLHGASATLAWDPSPSPNITGYTLRYGTTSGSYPSTLSAGTALSATVASLTVGTTYYFVVTVRNASGLESDPSNEISYTPSSTLPNVVPTLNAISNRTVNEDAGSQTVSLAGITAGLGDLLQVLTVSASSSNPGLIPNPAVSYASPNATGTLTFAPAANANGSATITVTVNDGGLVNNLVSRAFTVTVNPVNDPPTLGAMNNLTLNVNAGQQTVSLSGIGTGAANESQALTVTATSSNPGLVPTPTITYTSPSPTGTLRFTPAAGGTGAATITVRVNDGQSQSNITTRTFTVTVNPSTNTPPTLNALSNVVISEDAAQQSIGLSGITAGASETQPLTVTATSSNPGLIPAPSVSYTSPNSSGTLRFTPVASASGTATITVTVNDGQSQNNTISRGFTATINPVNDPPTLDGLNNVTLAQGAGPQTVALSGISSGAANEIQTLTISATSSNPGLVPTPTITYTNPNATGTLRFTPVAGASGTATIAVTVNDGQGQNNTITRSFTVTVSGPATQTIYAEAESGTRVSPMTVGSAANAVNGQYVYSATANAGTVSFPFTSQTGTYWIWCRVLTLDSGRDSFFISMDGAAEDVFTTAPNWSGSWQWTRVSTSSVARAYSLGQGNHTLVFRCREPSMSLDALYITSNPNFVPSAAGPNAAPTLDPLSNFTLPPSVGLRVISLTGISSGATNEDQALTVTVTSSNPALIPQPLVSYTSPASNGVVRFASVVGGTGTATITVTVNDGQSLNNTISRSFTVNIPVPDTVMIYLDAEAGTLVPPMTLAADPSGARYVYSSADDKGTLSLSINIPVAGNYWVWCKVLSPDNQRDSFFVAADGGTEEIYSTAANTWSSNWQWTRLNGHLTGGERVFAWGPGVHTLVFRGREDFTFLDCIYVSNRRAFTPNGTVAQPPIQFSATSAGDDPASFAAGDESNLPP